LDIAIEGGYDFLDGVIFVNSCDAMRRLHDVWKKNIDSKFIYILDIPMGNSPLGLNYIRAEFEKLKTALEEYTSKPINNEKLEGSVDTFIKSRILFQELNSLRQKNPPLVSGREIVNITLDFFKTDPISWNQKISDIISKNTKNPDITKSNNKPRVALAGSPIHDIDFISFIENSGLDVVYEDLCTGSKFFDVKINKKPDLLDSISEAYLNRTPCARMMRIEDRADKLAEISNKFNTNGIIHLTLKFCDTYLYDIPRLRELLIKKGLSVLFLESDGTLGSLNQLKTRIEAFAEMIKNKSSD
jgi:benzoyl-CoA reductase/2-hydroxyglutaryl-CoA dehydratase subunit BcrC/BadD/HgdB